MALRYVIKKRTFGFDKTKAEKYVAQNVITNTVDFRDLCEESYSRWWSFRPIAVAGVCFHYCVLRCFDADARKIH